MHHTRHQRATDREEGEEEEGKEEAEAVRTKVIGRMRVSEQERRGRGPSKGANTLLLRGKKGREEPSSEDCNKER